MTTQAKRRKEVRSDADDVKNSSLFFLALLSEFTVLMKKM